MDKQDWQLCRAKWLDLLFSVGFAMLSARMFRLTLFKLEFVRLEGMLEERGRDVEFWKAIFAYIVAAFAEYRYVKKTLN